MKSKDINNQASCLTDRMIRDTEWAVLSSEEIQIFNVNVVPRNYDVGETIFYEGDDCKGLYLVESGLIGVRKVDAEGKQILMRLGGPGDTLGYRPLLSGEKHRASAEVMKPGKICFLPEAIMRQFLASNPVLGARFLERTAKALGAAEERFFETVTLSARVRLIHLLMLLRENTGQVADDGSLFMEVQLTRRDIASMLGIRAESLSRLVREIEAEGLAHFAGSTVTINNPDQLLAELDAGLHMQ